MQIVWSQELLTTDWNSENQDHKGENCEKSNWRDVDIIASREEKRTEAMTEPDCGARQNILHIPTYTLLQQTNDKRNTNSVPVYSSPQ